MHAFIFVIGLSLAATAQAAEPLRLAVVGGGVWAPHLIDHAAERPGAAVEMRRLVLDAAALAVEEVVFPTVAEARAAFQRREVDAEIATLSWLDQPVSDGTRFSAAFYRTADRLYAAIGGPMAKSDCASLAAAPIWGVAGYRYPCPGVFSPPRLANERALVAALADRTIDLAVIDEHSARWWMRRLDAPLSAGSFVSETELRFRFHAASDRLLDRLDAAIARLRANRADRMIQRDYVR